MTTRSPVDVLADRLSRLSALLAQRGGVAWDKSREWQTEIRRGEGRGSTRADPTSALALARSGRLDEDALLGVSHVRLASRIDDAIKAIDAITQLVEQITANYDATSGRWSRPRREARTDECSACRDVVPCIETDPIISGLCRPCYAAYRRARSAAELHGEQLDLPAWRARRYHRRVAMADLGGEG